MGVVRVRRPRLWRPEWARPSVDPDSALAAIFPAEEKYLQQAAMDDARQFHWLAYHVHGAGAKRSASGFPDTVAVKTERARRWGPPFVAFVELKGRLGVMEPAQVTWGLVLRAIEAATGGMVAYRVFWPWQRPEMAAFFAGQEPIVRVEALAAPEMKQP